MDDDIIIIAKVLGAAILAGLLLAASYVVIAVLGAWSENKTVIPGPEPASTEELRKAHRYHGINLSEVDDETGEWIFWRDGKRCRLFAYLPKREGIVRPCPR